MRFIKLTLEYDGTNYAGWQTQTNALAIQDVVAEAVAKMTEENEVVRGASRTDAGVHALGQVATFATTRDISCHGFLKGLNSSLPADIRVVGCEEVSKDFHPIRNAKQKTYAYLLLPSNIESALWQNRAWCVNPALDIPAMKDASRCLIGEHDFKSFKGAVSTIKTTVRTIYDVSLRGPEGRSNLSVKPGLLHPFGVRNDIVCVTITANGFLKYMVRNIVGTLVEIGLGRMLPEEMKKILEAKDRTKAGRMAPACGLYLMEVKY
ncbi:MAG: tRNA pseudouridine(38-40) synthase TruA [Deltaproteobacteria bacterium]|nr:tRNA pseudouridine(38-40) synthase TruA [Deltaproteobacteria bacterium]